MELLYHIRELFAEVVLLIWVSGDIVEGYINKGNWRLKKHIKVLVLNVAKKNIRFYSLTLNKTTNTFSTLVAEIVDIIILVIF